MKNIISIVFYLFLLLTSSVHAQDEEEAVVETDPTVIDYIFQLLNGLKSDDYVPGSLQCSLDIIESNDDFIDLYNYFSPQNAENRPTDQKELIEENTFRTWAAFTNNLPRAIYNCYFIP